MKLQTHPFEIIQDSKLFIVLVPFPGIFDRTVWMGLAALVFSAVSASYAQIFILRKENTRTWHDPYLEIFNFHFSGGLLFTYLIWTYLCFISLSFQVFYYFCESVCVRLYFVCQKCFDFWIVRLNILKHDYSECHTKNKKMYFWKLP